MLMRGRHRKPTAAVKVPKAERKQSQLVANYFFLKIYTLKDKQTWCLFDLCTSYQTFSRYCSLKQQLK